MRRHHVFSLCFTVAMLAACQGAKDSALFDGNATPPPVDTGDSGVDAAAPVDAGDPDAAGDAASDAGDLDASADAAGDAVAPPAGGVYCSGSGENARYCNGVTPICCPTQAGPGQAYGLFACATEATCTGAGQAILRCDDETDCAAGEVCCITMNGATVSTVTCTAAAACPSSGSQTALCDRSKPDTCANWLPGTVCGGHDLLPGFGACQAP